MKQNIKPILCLLLLFAVSAILPSDTGPDFGLQSDSDSAILSQADIPACPAISDPVHIRGRISSGVVSAGWCGEVLKSSRLPALYTVYSHQQGAVRSEITLFSLDCMLQI